VNPNATQLGPIGFSHVLLVGQLGIGSKQGKETARGVDGATFVRDFDGEIRPTVDYQPITVHCAQGALLRG
jgi:hypothetical protein